MRGNYSLKIRAETVVNLEISEKLFTEEVHANFSQKRDLCHFITAEKMLLRQTARSISVLIPMSDSTLLIYFGGTIQLWILCWTVFRMVR